MSQFAQKMDGTSVTDLSGNLLRKIVVVGHKSLFTDQVDYVLFTAPFPVVLESINEVHTTVEAGGTLKILPKKCTGTQAPASGTALITNNTNTGFDGVGTAVNTVQYGTLTATAATLRFDTGDRLAIDYTDDVAGELAGVTITAVFSAI